MFISLDDCLVNFSAKLGKPSLDRSVKELSLQVYSDTTQDAGIHFLFQKDFLTADPFKFLF